MAGFWAANFGVVALKYGLYVFSARVGDLDCISVDDLVHFVGFREVLVYQAKEFLSYISGDSHVVGWVVPNNISFGFLSFALCWCFWYISLLRNKVEVAVVNIYR